MSGDPRSLDPPKIQNLAIFVHNGVEYKVGVICDAPHLLKNWKNALCRCVNGKKIRMDKSFQEYWDLETNEIELEAVQAVIDFQSKFEMKLHPKLTQKVLDEAQSTHGKMDVSKADNEKLLEAADLALPIEDKIEIAIVPQHIKDLEQQIKDTPRSQEQQSHD